MKYSLAINIDDERIVVRSKTGAVLVNIPNIIALDENDKFVSIGETPEMIQAKAPKEWEQVKDKTHFCKLFSIDKFIPNLAGYAINYLAYLATDPSPLMQNVRAKDSVTLQLHIPGYESLDAEIRDVFEYCTQVTGSIRVDSLFINNQVVILGNFRKADLSAKIGGRIAILLAFPLLYVLVKVFLPTGSTLSIPKDKDFLVFLVFLIAIMLSIQLTGLIFTIVWKVATRRLVSDFVSRMIIEQNGLGFSKPVMKLIWSKSLPKDGGG